MDNHNSREKPFIIKLFRGIANYIAEFSPNYQQTKNKNRVYERTAEEAQTTIISQQETIAHHQRDLKQSQGELQDIRNTLLDNVQNETQRIKKYEEEISWLEREASQQQVQISGLEQSVQEYARQISNVQSRYEEQLELTRKAEEKQQQLRLQEIQRQRGNKTPLTIRKRIAHAIRTNMHDSGYVIADHNGVILDIGGRAFRKMGYSAKNVPYKTIQDMLFPEDSQTMWAELLKARSKIDTSGFQFGSGVRINSKEGLYTHYRIKADIERQGEYRDIKLITFTLEREPHDLQKNSKAAQIPIGMVDSENLKVTTRRIENYTKTATADKPITLDLRRTGHLTDRLLGIIGDALASNPNINAIGIIDLPPKEYTALRDPFLKVPRANLGIMGVSYKMAKPEKNANPLPA